MQPTIHRDIRRPEKHIIKGLADQGVATTHEGFQRRGLLAPRLRPVSDGWHIAGPAVTSLNHPGDNLMVHAALSVCQPGDVLVVATTVPCEGGMIGDLLALQAKRLGLAGIVIDAGIRDIAEIRNLGIPVWTSAISAAGCVKFTPGWVNVPIICGDQLVSPGDVIVADDDGVVAIPYDQAENVLEAAVKRTASEVDARSAYEQGELSFDRSGLRQYLADKGVVEQ